MNSYVYIIDRNDLILSVSDNWALFAEENKAIQSCHPIAVINKPIWNFLGGDETHFIYKLLIEKVRANFVSLKLPFRCDAPDKRRYLDLLITPIQEKQIKFTSYIRREEVREPVELLKTGIKRSGEFIRMCSMCKKIEVTTDYWEEVETAVISLMLFEKHELPRITHGLCTGCFNIAMAEIEKYS